MYFLTGPILFFLLKFNYNFNKKKNYKRAKKFSKKNFFHQKIYSHILNTFIVNIKYFLQIEVNYMDRK